MTQERETVMNLLRDFGKTPGCEKAKTDGEKIKMVCMYLWLRQLTDGLTFERFLERYVPLVDHNAENLLHPDEAIRHHCPRNKAAAEKQGVDQWSANECVGILALYVDMVREAEVQGVEVPMTLTTYLAMDAPAVKKGEVELPKADLIVKPAKQAKGKRAAGPPAAALPETGLPPTGTSLRPNTLGQSIIYEKPNGHQIRGMVMKFTEEGDKKYVNFRDDDGQDYTDCAIEHCTVLDEAAPFDTPPADAVHAKLWIPKKEFGLVTKSLEMETPMGNTNLGDLIYHFEQEFVGHSVIADINVVNGETGPYVDAELWKGEDQLSSLDPRDNILGEYTFESSAGTFVLEVCTRGNPEE